MKDKMQNWLLFRTRDFNLTYLDEIVFDTFLLFIIIGHFLHLSS